MVGAEHEEEGGQAGEQQEKPQEGEHPATVHAGPGEVESAGSVATVLSALRCARVTAGSVIFRP